MKGEKIAEALKKLKEDPLRETVKVFFQREMDEELAIEIYFEIRERERKIKQMVKRLEE